MASPHDTVGFYYYVRNQVDAVRLGRWKLRMAHLRAPEGEPEKVPVVELFDLNNDISERTNLAATHPDIVRRLQQLIRNYHADLLDNSRPVWTSDSK